MILATIPSWSPSLKSKANRVGRSGKQLLGYWVTDDGQRVWVYKSGRNFWINYGNGQHLCHPSIRSLDDTKREAFLVFQVAVVDFVPAGYG